MTKVNYQDLNPEAQPDRGLVDLESTRNTGRWRPIVFCVLIGLLITVTAIGIAVSKVSKPATYEPNELQGLRLQVKQGDAKMAQQAFQQAQVNFQQALGALNREAEAIKQENKWPATVQFSPDTLKFMPAPEPPKPAPAAAPKKK